MTTAAREVVSMELFTITYGAMVAQVVRDYERPAEINRQLDLMGQRIGARLVDEFCSKTRTPRCRTFKDAMETVAKDAFRMFLGITAFVENWNAEGTSCTLRIPDNPLSDFVELPPSLSDLRYSNILCGAIHGALSALYYNVACTFTKDVLNGSDTNEIQVVLLETKTEAVSAAYTKE